MNIIDKVFMKWLIDTEYLRYGIKQPLIMIDVLTAFVSHFISETKASGSASEVDVNCQ
jgi:hypothetical protein